MPERMDDLQRNGLHILQKTDGFRFGMDALLLADFARLKPRDTVADLGTGTGILPLLMSQNEPTARFIAFEYQPDMADMAARSVKLNCLEERIRVLCADYRNAVALIGAESVHAIVCNPPYGKQGCTIPSESDGRLLSKHETDCRLDEIATAASSILRNHGRASFVFPAARLLELFDALRAARLEPKRVRMVQSVAEKPPYLALVEAVKNAKPALHWLPTLIVYDGDRKPTPEIERIYHTAKEDSTAGSPLDQA